MSRAAWCVWGMMMGLASLGCEGDPPPAPTPAPSVSAVPATAAPRSTIEPPGARYPDERVPVAEDFEGEAETAITADNYLRELQRLEAEIGGEPAPTDAKGGAPPAADTTPPTKAP